VSGDPYVDYIRHNDTITVRSIKNDMRLQNNPNKIGEFSNADRGTWEQLSIEKCGAPGKDNINC